MLLKCTHPGIILGLALIPAASGCNSGATDSLPRHEVSGTVTLDKKPLPSGSISFDPVEPGKPNAVSAGATIRDGSYSVPQAQGLTPGPYRVSINSTAEGGAVSLTEAPGAPPKVRAKDLVPEKYNAKSTLKSEVKAGESNRFDFELSSGK
jgi:hypothetical protein